MFREPEVTNVFETDNLAAAPKDADEMNMDIQNVSGDIDTSGNL